MSNSYKWWVYDGQFHSIVEFQSPPNDEKISIPGRFSQQCRKANNTEWDFNQLVSWPKEINCPIPEWDCMLTLFIAGNIWELSKEKRTFKRCHVESFKSSTRVTVTDSDRSHVFFTIFRTIPTLELWLLLCKLHSFTFISWEVYKFPLLHPLLWGKMPTMYSKLSLRKFTPILTVCRVR